jgi:hypothetical protein
MSHIREFFTWVPVRKNIPQEKREIYRKKLLDQALSSRRYVENAVEAIVLYSKLVEATRIRIYAELGTGVVLLNPATQREATHHGKWDLWSNGPARQGMRHYDRSEEDAVKWLTAPHANSKFD